MFCYCYCPDSFFNVFYTKNTFIPLSLFMSKVPLNMRNFRVKKSNQKTSLKITEMRVLPDVKILEKYMGCKYKTRQKR